MNYYIEKHDMNIILDALELLRDNMRSREKFGLPNDVYSIDDVTYLLQSFDDSFVEDSK